MDTKCSFFSLIMLMCCLLSKINNTSSDMHQSKNTIIISLGESCFPAMALKHYGLRQEAYPFDWIISSFNALYKTLENDFIHFLLSENLEIDAYNAALVVDKQFGFKFVHDFPLASLYTMAPGGSTLVNKPHYFDQNADIDGHLGIVSADFKMELAAVKKKYMRRIDRFLMTLKSTQRIIFIRNDASKTYNTYLNNNAVHAAPESLLEQAILLKELLERKFSSLDFLIVFAANNQEMKLPWMIDKIKNYYVPVENPTVGGDYMTAWEKIFKELQLLP